MELSFFEDDRFSMEKFSMIGGSKTLLKFDFTDAEDGLPLDITTSIVTWTLSEFGQSDFTILTKTGVLSGSESQCIVTLDSVDTKELEGKFIQQVALTDYLGDEYVVGQGVLKINKNNNNDI